MRIKKEDGRRLNKEEEIKHTEGCGWRIADEKEKKKEGR